MLLEEFKGMFPVLLLVSAVLCFFANTLSPGEGYDFIGLALLAVVILNASVSFVQRHKVEQLMQSFQDYIPKRVALMRDGERKVLDAKEIVPGDILLVQEGDRISADGVILSATELMVDESTNTWVATETGTLTLEFSNASGNPWIDHISDVKRVQP